MIKGPTISDRAIPRAIQFSGKWSQFTAEAQGRRGAQSNYV